LFVVVPQQTRRGIGMSKRGLLRRQTDHRQERTQTTERQRFPFGHRAGERHQSNVWRDWCPVDERGHRPVRRSRIVFDGYEQNSRSWSETSHHRSERFVHIVVQI